MIISLPVMSLMFEIEDVIQKKPVMLLKMCAEMKLKNWSNSLEMKGAVYNSHYLLVSGYSIQENNLGPNLSVSLSFRLSFCYFKTVVFNKF